MTHSRYRRTNLVPLGVVLLIAAVLFWVAPIAIPTMKTGAALLSAMGLCPLTLVAALICLFSE